MTNHTILALGSVLITEVLIVAITGGINHVGKSKKLTKDPFFSNAFEKIIIRFAKPEDYESIMVVFLEYFPAQTSLSPEEYRLLLAPSKQLVRVIEGGYGDGRRLIIGYYSVWPLSFSTLDDLKGGGMKESELNSTLILSIENPAAETLYISEIAISQTQPFGKTLMRDARSYIGSLLSNNKNIKSISAWGYSDIGEVLASRVGMKRYMGPNNKPTEFFEVKIKNLDKVTKKELEKCNQDFNSFLEIKI